MHNVYLVLYGIPIREREYTNKVEEDTWHCRLIVTLLA